MLNSLRISNKGLKYKIIEDLGRINGRHRVRIKFIDSGYESIVPQDLALNGSVVDRMAGYNENKIFQSNVSGPFKMIEWIGVINCHAKIRIKFINTGYEKVVQLRNALDGKVRDDTLTKYSDDFDPSRMDNYDNYIIGKLKSMYDKLITRCTNKNSPVYRFYGERGVKVCDRWLESFDNFLEDIVQVDRFEKFYDRPYLYSLDKDYKQLHLSKNQRVYSKETCIFLNHNDNSNVAKIEFRMHNQGYFGVTVNKAGNYAAGITLSNNTFFYIGTFSNEIAAANAFNYWYEYFHNYEIIPLFNNVPYMPPDEFIKYNVAPKIMCEIV